MMPACSSGTLTSVLQHRNAMPDIPPRHSIQPIYVCATIFMSPVRPKMEILPWPSTHTNEHSTLGCCYGGSQTEAR